MNNRTRSSWQPWFTLVLVVGVSTLSARAEKPDLSAWIKKNMADDHARCAAYFTVMSNVPGLSKSIQSQYESSALRALRLSIDYGSEKRTRAATELAAESMVREVRDDDGLMVLMNEHGYFCKDLLEQPEKHIEELKQQE